MACIHAKTLVRTSLIALIALLSLVLPRDAAARAELGGQRRELIPRHDELGETRDAESSTRFTRVFVQRERRSPVVHTHEVDTVGGASGGASRLCNGVSREAVAG